MDKENNSCISVPFVVRTERSKKAFEYIRNIFLENVDCSLRVILISIVAYEQTRE